VKVQCQTSPKFQRPPTHSPGRFRNWRGARLPSLRICGTAPGRRLRRAGREPLFSISEEAELSAERRRDSRCGEGWPGFPEPPRTETNRRVGYTLAQVNDMRGVFGTATVAQA